MDESLKTRLIGAAVLIAILAIIWPLAFDDAEQIKLSRASQIPAKPAVQKWQPAEMSLPEHSQTGWPDTSAEETKPNKATVATVKEDKKPVPKVAKPKVEKVKPTPASTASTFRPSWVVQVASLSDRGGAKKLVSKLQSDGYRAYMKEQTSDGKTQIRVFVGPKFDKRKALSMKKAIDKSYGVSTLVLRFQPSR